MRLLLCLLVSLGSYFAILHATGNFHVVLSGELYRSAQVSAADVERYAKQHHIRSIINLRGDNSGQAWYDHEVAASENAGIAHYNFRMSARRELTTEQAHTLIKMMQDAPKPLLVHCKAGMDRSGLAAALYMLHIKGESPEVAEQQLSPIYGHIAQPFMDEYAMDRSFAKLTPLFTAPKFAAQ